MSLWIPLLLPGEGNGTPLQYSCLENPMERGAWWAAVHGVVKIRTQLSDFTFTFHFHALEKEMTTHSSVLAWRIPGTGEPGRLPSMGSHRVGHDWSDLAAAAAIALRRCVSFCCICCFSPWLCWYIFCLRGQLIKMIPQFKGMPAWLLTDRVETMWELELSIP